MRWTPGKLAKDSTVLTLGMLLRGLAQGIVFIIIARTMGTNGYGAFVSVLALSSTLAGFTGFGSHILLIKDTALDKNNFGSAWGNTLTNLGISIPIIFLLYIIISFLFVSDSVSLQVILLIGVADMVFFPLSNICTSAYQGFEKMGSASRMILVPIVIRLIAAILFLLISLTSFTKDLLLTWSVLYLISAILASVYSQLSVKKDYGLPDFSKKSMAQSRIKEGMPFSFWHVSHKLYNDADKLILAKMTTLDITGIYSAAHRLVDLFTIPILGLIEAATPKSFKAGNIGISQSLVYTTRLIKFPLLYALSASFSIYILSGFLPYLIGDKYQDSIIVIKYLSILPLMIVPKLFLQHILATSGHQKIVMWVIILGALINISSNLILIPVWGWSGAVASNYIAEIIISLTLTFLIFNLLHGKKDEIS